MKVVYILKSSLERQGGLERFAVRAASIFQKIGKKVVILTTGKGVYVEGCSSISLINKIPASSFIHTYLFEKKVASFLKEKPLGYVFGLDRNSYQTHMRLGNGLHCQFLEQRKLFESSLKGFIHQMNPLHRQHLYLEKKAFLGESLKKIYTNSEMVKEEVARFHPDSLSKVRVVYNPVFIEKFTLSSEGCDKKHRFLFVGHGYQRKGLPFLLEVLKMLQHLPWNLTVVGKEKQLSYYKKMAREYGLQEKVYFLGELPDCKESYQNADTFLFPSYYDPFANVTLEALASGLFVITSPFNGGKEVISQENGLVLPFDIGMWRYFIEKRIQNVSPSKVEREKIRMTVTRYNEDMWTRVLEEDFA